MKIPRAHQKHYAGMVDHAATIQDYEERIERACKEALEKGIAPELVNGLRAKLLRDIEDVRDSRK